MHWGLGAAWGAGEVGHVVCSLLRGIMGPVKARLGPARVSGSTAL